MYTHRVNMNMKIFSIIFRFLNPSQPLRLHPANPPVVKIQYILPIGETHTVPVRPDSMYSSSFMLVSLALALDGHADILEVPTTFVTGVQAIATSATSATAANTNIDSQPISTTASDSSDGKPFPLTAQLILIFVWVICPIAFLIFYFWGKYRCAKRERREAIILIEQANSGDIELVGFEYPVLERVPTPPPAYQRPPNYVTYPSRPPSYATVAGAPPPRGIADIPEEEDAVPGTGKSLSASDTLPSASHSS